MKKALILILATTLISLSGYSNILTNGSFESGADTWKISNSGSASVSTNFQFSDPFTGVNSAQIGVTVVSGDSSGVFLQLPTDWSAEFRKVYRLSFQLKSNTDARFSILAFDSTGAVMNVFKHLVCNSIAADGWQKYTFYYTSNQQGTGSLKFGLMLGYDVATFVLDDFVLETDNSYFPEPVLQGAYSSGYYRNLFAESGKTQEQIQTKLNAIFNQLFYGNNSTQRVYYQISDTTAYILDTYNKDIRSEGMSYGMMIAVQMNRKFEFDCMWNFAKNYMQHKTEPRKGYFSWSINPKTLTMNDPNSAPDGEEYFAMALFFAAHRWGNGEGIFNYETEANQLLYDMLHLEERNGGVVSGLKNMFNLNEKKVVFTPQWENADYSDPSYHLPAFYELWALWAKQDNDFWAAAADTSRVYFQKAMHPKTGFVTEYMTFDAKPKQTTFNERSHCFSGDSWRAAMNVAMDCSWWGNQDWQTTKIDSLLEFVNSKGSSYQSQYTQDGQLLSPNWEGAGFYAMNAVAPLAARTQNSWNCINKFWNLSLPTGTYRYYDGLLYMLAYLNVSGEYKIWKPGDTAITPDPVMPVVTIFNPFAPEPDPTGTGINELNDAIDIIVNQHSIEIKNNSDEKIDSIQLIDITGKSIPFKISSEQEKLLKIVVPDIKGVLVLVIKTRNNTVTRKFVLSE